MARSKAATERRLTPAAITPAGELHTATKASKSAAIVITARSWLLVLPTWESYGSHPECASHLELIAPGTPLVGDSRTPDIEA